MRNSYLIQRLRKPHDQKSSMSALGDALAFGGGLLNGGLSNEAFKLLSDAFRFDYMGAAEFEFGAVPEALERMAKNHKSLITMSISMTTKQGNSGRVFILCRSEHMDEVVNRIKRFASNDYGPKKYYTKELVHLNANINGENFAKDICGWIELDNGYFFSTDREMFEKTASLFGVDTSGGTAE